MKSVTIIIRASYPENITRAELDAIASAAAVQVSEPEGLLWSTSTETFAHGGVGPFTVQRFRAKNDRNGNPRRVFVFRNGTGDIVQTTDEGYGGREAIRAFEREYDCTVTDIGDATATPTEYKELLRHQP